MRHLIVAAIISVYNRFRSFPLYLYFSLSNYDSATNTLDVYAERKREEREPEAR